MVQKPHLFYTHVPVQRRCTIKRVVRKEGFLSEKEKQSGLLCCFNLP